MQGRAEAAKPSIRPEQGKKVIDDCCNHVIPAESLVQ